jgi:hypothetical protein
LGRRSENMSFSHSEVSYGEHDEGDFFQLPSSSEDEIELDDGTDSDGAESATEKVADKRIAEAHVASAPTAEQIEKLIAGERPTRQLEKTNTLVMN